MSPPEKSSLRETYRQKRDALSPSDHAKLSHAACEKAVMLAGTLGRPGQIIAGYSPIGSELDISPAFRPLSVGHSVALPIVLETLTLGFRRYHPGDTLTKGRFGILEPGWEGESVVPDLLLVPLLAFDRQGHRAGYGKGYYDATLAGLRAQKPIIAIGVAFAVQEVEAIPAEPFDQRLDGVVTEKELIRF